MRGPGKKNVPSSLFDREGLVSPVAVQWLARRTNSILLESGFVDRENKHTYLFIEPVEVVKASSLGQVERALRRVDEAVQSGHYVAGFLSYEAGYAFEKALETGVTLELPLVWFGVFRRPVVYDRLRRRVVQGHKQIKQIEKELERLRAEDDRMELSLTPSLSQEEYHAAISSIKNFILAGDTYQVNYTFKLKFPWLSSSSLYCRLRNAQRVGYSAFLTLRGFNVLSFSPELFFRLDGSRITLKPMKGTAPRGRTLEEDVALRKQLQASDKNRAENLMIVDMLRNDVGRIARTGSVRVARFFDIERYETVFQATSTIEARLRRGVTYAEVVRSLFPSGSVTGAPKIRTMQIIRELEKEPRRIYTGSIGFIAPRKKAVFSVAIRTAVLDRKTGMGEMGVGSGIVHDSTIDEEYQECLLKSRFLAESPSDFALIETMRWEPGRGFLLQRLHARRLLRSTEYFGFPCDSKTLKSILKRYDARLRRESKRQVLRVRLTLRKDGTINFTHARLKPTIGEQHVRLAEKRTDSSDRFLFHKTTHRRLYDEELERAVLKGYFDVLFLNEKGELTEGARTNLVVRKQGDYLTPPVSCGLLAGVYRDFLFRSKKYAVKECILTPNDLKAADEVFVCNAVRGMVKVTVDWT